MDRLPAESCDGSPTFSSHRFFVLIGILDFRRKVAELYDRIVDHWRNSVISRIVDEHHLASRPIHPAFTSKLR
jgi:hypothetical protein